MTALSAHRILRGIARACGVATSYIDSAGKRIDTKPDVLVRMINAVSGRDLVKAKGSAKAYRVVFDELRAERTRAGLPATVIAWDGQFPAVWLPVANGVEEIVIMLEPEEGEAATHVQVLAPDDGHGGSAGRRIRLAWTETVPVGYYTLRVGDYESFLISAPRHVEAADNKSWGAFAPTYALRAAHDHGIGGYRELAQAATFVKQQGGAFLGTLPLLPAFYESENPNPSPYSPVSRLFWNEIFLDLNDLPGQTAGDFAARFEASRAMEAVDYAEVYRLKKEILSEAADTFFSESPEGDEGYKAYAAASPNLQAYAEFRAAKAPGHERAAAIRLHLYAQYACHRQLSAMKARATAGECAELYLDYPVGVDPDGFDGTAFKDLFLDGFNVGAPPDLFFAKGQDWGFRPLSPRRLAADRFRYFRATIHHYFRYARMLRLDHVMGLFRLYCVPHAEGAHKGAYIYYPFEALMAVLCLEAHRHDGILVGENLGTVPQAVDRGMKDHGVNRMWIFYFEMNELPARSFDSIEVDMIAGINTHDMFPFTAFLKGSDLVEMVRLELMTDKHAAKMQKDRDKMLRKWKKADNPLMDALEGVAASPARFVLVSLEDLWGETEPQNVPGTVDQYPNWRKKFAHVIEDWADRDDVRAGIAVLNKHRGTPRHPEQRSPA